MIPFHRIPFFRIFLFLVLGILLQQYTNPTSYPLKTTIVLFSGATVLLFIYYRYWRSKYHLRWVPGLALGSLFTLSGFLLSQHQTPKAISSPIVTQGVGIIKSIEFREEDRIRITLQPEAFQQSTPLRVNDQLLLMIQGPLDAHPREGDRLHFKGVIRPLPTTTNPDAFDYGQFLQRNGFFGQAFLKSNEILLEPSKNFNFRFLPALIRNKCLAIFRSSGISEPALVIVQALLLGDRSGMDRETQDSFIKSGAIHLLAVSGLHVGILYMLLGSVLSLFFKPSNVISILLSLVFLLSFAFLTGFSPSVSRAALMFAIIHIGRATNRNANIYNSLAVSASLLLMINPLFLFHVGYWLSHLAVMGIVAFYPYLNGLLQFRFIVGRYVWSLIAVALAAQITTLPVSLYTFGAFPTWFLLSNLLLLPLVAPILLLAIATLFFSFSPLLSTIFAGGLNDLLLFMAEMALAIERLPYGYLEHLWLSFPLVIICYIALHQIGQLCFQRNGKYWIGVAVSLLALAGGLNLQWYHKVNSEQLVVYDTRQGLLIDLILGGQILTIESEGLDQPSKNYARNNYIKQYHDHHQPSNTMTLKGDTLPEIHEIRLGAERVLILYGKGKETIVPSAAYKAHTIIIGGPLNIDIRKLIEKTNCRTIVAASNCPHFLVEKWKKETDHPSLTFYSIKEKGAFIFSNRYK